jgi:hypothetical protein
MRQLAAQAVQIIHKDGLHQPLPYKVAELRKLWAVEGCARVVIDKDMGIWDGIAFLPRHGLAGVKLGRQRVPFVGLIRVETRV